jgi:hypothetical protein
MSLLCSFEKWSAASEADTAMRLVESASQLFPSMTTALLNIVGNSRQIKISVSHLHTRVPPDREWSVELLAPKRLEKSPLFAISDPSFSLIVHKDLCAFYLYAGEGEANRRLSIVDMACMLVKVVGVGIGYCTEFSSATEAAVYSMDLRVASSAVDLAGFLQKPARLSWSENLRYGPPEWMARNLFE